MTTTSNASASTSRARAMINLAPSATRAGSGTYRWMIGSSTTLTSADPSLLVDHVAW
jgi:hypothetical protein